MKEIKTVLIVGAGVMGHGFAQIFALNGLDVLLMDQSQELLLVPDLECEMVAEALL